MSDLHPAPYDPKARRGVSGRFGGTRLRLWLITAGVCALALIFIVATIAVVVHRRSSHHAVAGVAQTFAAPRAGNNGTIGLTANAATVSLHPLDAANANLLQGSFTPGKNRGDALLNHKGDAWQLSEENGDPETSDSAAWDIGVASGVTINLTLTLNATSSDVNLQALTLSAFRAEANASTLRLVLPAAYSGDVKGTITAAAGNVQITVPAGAAVRVVIGTKAGSRDVPARFVPKNGGYETPEYAGAKNRLTLTITANAGRVTLV